MFTNNIIYATEYSVHLQQRH